MSSGTLTQGRRLPDGSDISAVKQPGDYLLMPQRDAIWCVLPNGVVNRIPVAGLRGSERPVAWGMEEHGDGTITLTPSINLHPVEGVHSGWHGYLERGVWREV